MKQRRQLSLFFLFLFTAAWYAHARELIPASARDIMRALGVDGRGLELSQDHIPDLFTLTATGIDQDPKKFILQEPFVDGRWKGGWVTIEYARDLSYTLVNIYDKNGKRQRIYSVTAKTRTDEDSDTASRSGTSRAEESSYDEPQSDEVIEVAAAPGNTAQPGFVGVRPSDRGVWQAGEGRSVRRSAREEREEKRSKKQKQKEAAAEPPSGGSGDYVWDEAAGAYVPVKIRSAASAGKKQEAAPPPPAKTEVAETPAPKKSDRRSKSRSESASTASTTPGGQYVWDEKKGAYIPAERASGGTSVVSVPDVAPVTEASDGKKSKKRSKRGEETVVASLPAAQRVAPPMEKVDLHPTPVVRNVDDFVMPPSKDSGKSTRADDQVPSTEELLAMPMNESSSRQSSKASKKRESAAVSVPVAATPAKAAESLGLPPIPGESVTPVREEKPARASASSRREESVRAPEPTGPDTSAADSWTPKKVTKPVVVEEPVIPEPPVSAKKSSRSEGAVEEAGPMSLDSDAWTPKKTKQAVPEDFDAASASEQVAMVPKKSAHDNSIDDLLQAAAQAKAGAPEDSERWVPRKVALPKGDSDIAAELEAVRRREQQPKQAPAPPKVRRDVNNPEEGVLPVSQFEKFSGPRYGRHREYERRFFYGKRSNAPVADYDFYVDEVDRKKEIHNVYYYKKGKVPKLVAVERHEKVAFLSNYDVGKEDKGKVTKYD